MQQYNPAKLNKNAKQAQGYYTPKNPKKYVGNLQFLIYRSSWEKDFMMTCDLNPAILEWVCEPFAIPYKSPIDGKMKNYFPDFLISYIDASGNKKVQMIEIKPFKQCSIQYAKSKKDKIAAAVNTAKWAYAREYCKRNNIEFKILTEKDMYKK